MAKKLSVSNRMRSLQWNDDTAEGVSITESVGKDEAVVFLRYDELVRIAATTLSNEEILEVLKQRLAE